jgi:hypothetical protein
MLRFINIFIAIFLFSILGGCAVGVTHQYSNAALQIKATTGSKLGIGVQDRRLYVVTKEKPENFAGLSRGGFGNPFIVRTASGAPLADDISKSIQAALSNSGVNVSAINIPVGIDEVAAIKLLAATNGKAVLIELNEWKADTYMSTNLTYDVRALVIDVDGKVISSKKISGSENLGGSAMNPPEHSRKAVPIAFRKKIEELFSAPEIANNI